MKSSQILRLERINYESFYLLNHSKEDNRIVFDISGSTSNIYSVKYYTTSNTIYCNCPDSRSGAKYNGVLCKHCCFILVKVLKLKNKMEFFENYKLTQEQVNDMLVEYNKLNLQATNEFINEDYIKKYKQLKEDKNNDKIILRDDHNLECAICYDELSDVHNLSLNSQCKVCLTILHKSCLNKWLSMGHNSCPYCRSLIKSSHGYKNLFL